jgi:hypothetical protein
MGGDAAVGWRSGYPRRGFRNNSRRHEAGLLIFGTARQQIE